MIGTVLAQVGGYSIPRIAIFPIVACAVVGVAIVIIRQTGVQAPGWAISVPRIVLAAPVGVLAIKFLASVA